MSHTRAGTPKSERSWQEGFIAASRSMQELIGLVERVARTSLPVLLFGETGSGKEVVAQALHQASALTGPLIAVNCAALPETLAESELFGHVRGAFSGASTDKQGLLEAAEGGTIFFDEVGELPLPIQGKLLRVLENRELRRVGSTHATHVSCRILSATHRDLEASVASGLFREDLYHRLNGITLSIPPLRERPEDFSPLIERFLREAAGEGPLPLIHPDTIEELQDFPWRGNVRELKQAVYRAVILGGRVLSTRDFLRHQPPRESADALGPWLSGKRWKEIERAILIWHLLHAKGMRQAARNLDIPKSTLFDKVRTLKIPIIWSAVRREHVLSAPTTRESSPSAERQ